MRDKLKISSFEEIHHVALNENEFKTVNNLFVNNDSNSNSNDDFVSAVLFMCFVFLTIVFNVTAH